METTHAMEPIAEENEGILLAPDKSVSDLDGPRAISEVEESTRDNMVTRRKLLEAGWTLPAIFGVSMSSDLAQITIFSKKTC